MIVCRHCGWENPAEAAFCTNCGRGLGRSRPVGTDPAFSEPLTGAARRFRSLEAARSVAVEADEPLPPLRAPDGPPVRDVQATLIDFSLQAVLAGLRAPTDPPVAAPPGDRRPLPADAEATPSVEIPTLPEPVPARAELDEAPPARPGALLAPPSLPASALLTLDEEIIEELPDDPNPADARPSEPPEPEAPPVAFEPASASPEGGGLGRLPPTDDGDADDLVIPADSVDEEADRLLNDTDAFDSVDLEPEAPAPTADTAPAGLEDAPSPVAREEADFEAEEISASDLDAEESPAADLHLLDSGEFEAVPPAARSVPPPLPEIEVRFVLRPLSHTVSASRLVPIGDRPVVLGRGEVDVQVTDDRYLSPRHALFYADDAGLFVEDLDSLNGVWLRVRKDVVLRPGDEFMVGRQVLRLERVRPSPDGDADAAGTRRLGTPRHLDGARLVQLGADGVDRDIYHVSPEGCRLGRHIADIVFTDDGFMSGTHALLMPRGDAFVLRDLSSRNGTWFRVAGRRALAVGDAVMLGQTVWRVGQPVG
jgi:pSer/pThr/pTyr-binding forkhead associated (FHA) protein